VRALGPTIATGNFSDAWLYLIAPTAGAIIAAIVHTGLVRLAQSGRWRLKPAAFPGRPPNEALAKLTKECSKGLSNF
jgi:aquaporin Z